MDERWRRGGSCQTAFPIDGRLNITLKKDIWIYTHPEQINSAATTTKRNFIRPNDALSI